MFVGVARIVLAVPGARSLKDKRHTVHALRDRVRARLSVSIAEVGELDRHQVAVLGVTLVARDSSHCSELMSQVVKLAEAQRDAFVSDVATEVIPFGEAGRGVQGGIEQALDRLSPQSGSPGRVSSHEEDEDEP